MQKLVSVGVPIYGVEKWLPSCIDSIIGQTYKNLEIILVDDGGSKIDNCPEICEQYATIDNRIKVVHHQENQGRSGARNSCLKNATGEYFMFVDGDNMLKCTAVEECVRIIESENADAVAFYMDHVDEEATYYEIKKQETFKKKSNTECEIEIISGKGMLKKMFGTIKEKSVSEVCWNKLYKKNQIDNTLFIDNYYEDAFWLPDIYLKVYKWCIVGRELYHYRVRGNSAITAKPTLRRLIDGIDMVDHRRQVIKSIGDRELLQRATREYLKGCITKWDLIKHEFKDNAVQLELLTRFKQSYVSLFNDMKTLDRIVFGLAYVSPRLFIRLLSVYNKSK